MLAALLQERFKLKTHEDMKEERVYRLLPANNGPKLQRQKKKLVFQDDRTKPVLSKYSIYLMR